MIHILIIKKYFFLFNDEKVRNYKTKERSVSDFVKQEFTLYNWIEDKKIEGGCSKRRPDLLLDVAFDNNSIKNNNSIELEEKVSLLETNTQVIIIEIDEDQHEHYNSLCENKRLMEISRDLNHRPLIVIKFNPDEYKKDGKKITSCWGLDKNGICKIKKNKKVEWQDRLNLLKNKIDYWISNKTNKTLEIDKLFYDQAF